MKLVQGLVKHGLVYPLNGLNRMTFGNLFGSEQIGSVVVYSLDRFSRDPVHGVILMQELEKQSYAIGLHLTWTIARFRIKKISAPTLLVAIL